ncbi:MAG: type II toxin-antitoxin system VapB family antitoxin [Vicinamibacterales bacterium]
MRTTLDLPDGLVEQAREAIGFKSKTDTVVFALKEIVRRQQKDELKAFITTMKFDVDPIEIRKKDRLRMQRAHDRR